MAREQHEDNGEIRAIGELPPKQRQRPAHVTLAHGIEQGKDGDLRQARKDGNELCAADAPIPAVHRHHIELLVEIAEVDGLHHADRRREIRLRVPIHVLVQALQLALQPLVDVPGTDGVGLQHKACLIDGLVELLALIHPGMGDENAVAVVRHILKRRDELCQRLVLATAFPARRSLVLILCLCIRPFLRGAQQRAVLHDDDMARREERHFLQHACQRNGRYLPLQLLQPVLLAPLGKKPPENTLPRLVEIVMLLARQQEDVRQLARPRLAHKFIKLHVTSAFLPLRNRVCLRP